MLISDGYDDWDYNVSMKVMIRCLMFRPRWQSCRGGSTCSEHLHLWTSPPLNAWTFEHTNFWSFEHLNLWTFKPSENYFVSNETLWFCHTYNSASICYLPDSISSSTQIIQCYQWTFHAHKCDFLSCQNPPMLSFDKICSCSVTIILRIQIEHAHKWLGQTKAENHIRNQICNGDWGVMAGLGVFDQINHTSIKFCTTSISLVLDLAFLFIPMRGSFAQFPSVRARRVWCR